MSLNFSDYDCIKLSELLEYFGLKLNLSKNLMDLEIEDILKSARLIIEDNKYIFKSEGYTLTINPKKKKKTLYDYQDPQPDIGILHASSAVLDWDGNIRSIT